MFLSRKVCKTNSSAVYFGSLAIVEFIYLLFQLIHEIQSAWGVQMYRSGIACETFNFLLITPQYLVSFSNVTGHMLNVLGQFLNPKVGKPVLRFFTFKVRA